MQKVLLARALARQPRALVVAHPTRGLDIGAYQYVHAQLAELRDTGTGVLVISEDLDELPRALRPDRCAVPRVARRRARCRRRHQRPPGRDDDRRGGAGMRLVLRGHEPRWVAPLAVVAAGLVTLALTAIPIRLAGANPPAAFERYLITPLSTTVGHLRGAADRDAVAVHGHRGGDRVPGRLLEHRRRGPVPRRCGRHHRAGAGPAGPARRRRAAARLRRGGRRRAACGPRCRPGSSGTPRSTRW